MLTLKQEILRKTVHLLNSIIVLIFYLYGKETTLYILIPISIGFVIIDLLRINTRYISRIYNYFFEYITREEENKKLTGASYVFIAYSLIILFFDREIAIPSLLIMSISDSLAALIGKKYGLMHIGTKTIEGSLTFFISSIIIITFSSLNIYIGIICCVITTFVELFTPKEIDDNLLIPFCFAIFYLLIFNTSIYLNIISVN